MDHADGAASPLTGALTVGTRLRCVGCGSELIVITAGDAAVSCCGESLAPVAPPRR